LLASAYAAEPIVMRFLCYPQMVDSDDGLELEASVNGCVVAIMTHDVRNFMTGRAASAVE